MDEWISALNKALKKYTLSTDTIRNKALQDSLTQDERKEYEIFVKKFDRKRKNNALRMLYETAKNFVNAYEDVDDLSDAPEEDKQTILQQADMLEKTDQIIIFL